jgi:hypothetical protein
MIQNFPHLHSLDLVLEAAKDFGLTEEEVRATTLAAQFRSWVDPNEASPKLRDQIAGALARAVLDKQRRILAARDDI